MGHVAFLKRSLDATLYKAGEVIDSVSEWSGNAIWLRGTEKHTGEVVATLYFGTERSFDHLIDKLYDDYTVERRIEDRPLLTGSRWLKSTDRAVDLVIGDLPWPYYKRFKGPEFVHVPALVIQKLALKDTWEDVVGAFRKNTRSTDMRKIRKWNLSYRLTTAADELAEFYDKMYLPYAERRFGSLSVVDSRDEVIRVARRGTLLQVLHENRVVSAAVLVGHKRTIHFFWLGLPDGLDPRLLDAALSGLYFYTIRYAHAQGYRDLDLSYTAPLLNDGVYRYKRKWGAAVHDEWTIDELLLRPLNLAPGVASFFVHQPAMTRERGGLAAKVLLSDEDVSPGAITDLVEHYASAGMQSLKICSLRPFGSEVRGRSYGDGVPVELIELAHAADPAAAFCAC